MPSFPPVSCLYLDARGREGRKKFKKCGKFLIGSFGTLNGRLVPPGPPLFFFFSPRGTSGPPWSPLWEALQNCTGKKKVLEKKKSTFYFSVKNCTERKNKKYFFFFCTKNLEHWKKKSTFYFFSPYNF